MRTRLSKMVAGLAAIAALALGGAALASGGQSNSQPVKPAVVVKQATTAADTESKDGTSAADTDTIQDQSGSDSASEKAGTEQSSTAEQAGTESAGSEVAGNDGPGGHADEPGNPNADNQLEGVQ